MKKEKTLDYKSIAIGYEFYIRKLEEDNSRLNIYNTILAAFLLLAFLAIAFLQVGL